VNDATQQRTGAHGRSCLPAGVERIKVTRADDCGLEVSDLFTDLGEAVQAVARHMARSGVYEIRVAYLAS
jgi:hypothetical protein